MKARFIRIQPSNPFEGTRIQYRYTPLSNIYEKPVNAYFFFAMETVYQNI